MPMRPKLLPDWNHIAPSGPVAIDPFAREPGPVMLGP